MDDVELLLVPDYWSAEKGKVANAFKGEQYRTVAMKYDIQTQPYWKIRQADVDSISNSVLKNRLINHPNHGSIIGRTFATRDALKQELASRLSTAMYHNNADTLSQKGKCFLSGTATVSSNTMDQIKLVYEDNAFQTDGRGKVSHIRWFGHGGPGKVTATEDTMVKLDDLASIMCVTGSARLTLYCCETGKVRTSSPTPSYSVANAPKYILTKLAQLPEFAALHETEKCLINSSKTTNMWSVTVPSHITGTFLFDRHTVLGAGGTIEDVTEEPPEEDLMSRGPANMMP